MQDTYYELIARPSSHSQLFCDFLLELTDEAVEETDGSLVVRSEEPLKIIQWGLEQFAHSLSEALQESITVTIQCEQKRNEDWIKNYQQSIQPIAIDPFYVRPSWHPPKPSDDNHCIDIIIDPSLAFGSGHHESTANCLALLPEMVEPHTEVLDVGCGSGILSIACAKLGATVDLCDTDPLALQGSRQNFETNQSAFRHIWEGSAHQRSDSYDLVIANIVADVLIFIATDLKSAVKQGGHLLLSGIVSAQKDKLLRKFSDLEMLQERCSNGWHTLLYRVD